MAQRMVYFVSESTAITVSYLGKSLLSQFPCVQFEKRIVSYIKTLEDAKKLMDEWQCLADEGKPKPLVFATMAENTINTYLSQGYCHYYEFFNRFIGRLEKDLNTMAIHRSGLSHGLNNQSFYDENMDIINFALAHDDAMKLKGLAEADVILLGVSRSGKTPTCLYLALHYGIRAANYPLTDDDIQHQGMPPALKAYQAKLAGLSISAKRLHAIREKRYSNSQYASLASCQAETRFADQLFQRYRLPTFNTTTRSIEELASMIVKQLNLQSRKI